MAKYFSHKPQYRRGTTPRPTPVLDFSRDFRSGEFQFTGPVYTPDPRSAPGRVPTVPRKKGARSWSSPVNFTPAPDNRAAKRAFYRNLGRGIGGVFRGAQFAMDLWDIYDDVQRSIGGEPYNRLDEVPYAGGPDENTVPPAQRNWSAFQVPGDPTHGIVVPTPDGLGGWTVQTSDAWLQGSFLRQFRHNNGQWYWGKPFDGWHRPPANPSATYPIPGVLALGDPPVIVNGRYVVQNRLHTNLTPVASPEQYGTSLGPYRYDVSKPVKLGIGPIRWNSPLYVNRPYDMVEIRSKWPTDTVSLSSLLPWGGWEPGVAWRHIPARNKLLAQFPDIRTESNGPPLNPNEVPGTIHKPPPKGVVETKRNTNSAAVLWWYRGAKKVWHEAGEYCDRVNAIFDALPKDVRTSYSRSGSGRNVFVMRPKISCADKTAIILRNLHRLDVNEAITNLVVNEIEDRIIGAGFKSLDDAARRLGIPGWRVDLGMNGNVETAIEFLFEIKKALTP